jgi:lipopolysaccharide/colanic/teichoic acid biosynthesis glycosyltransferase
MKNIDESPESPVVKALGLDQELSSHSTLTGATGAGQINFAAKRAFDLLLGALIILLLSPLIILTALLIRLIDGGPVFFHQTRVGLNGHPFEFIKFRSMRVQSSDSSHQAYVKRWIQGGEPFAHDSEGKPIFKMAGDPRITRLGALIRRTSIDELPQLFNVLRNEMSLVGPRPAIPYEVDMYSEWHRRRLAAPPGITGLWQVSGRNRMSFDEMVRLDIDYMDNWSLVGDLGILMRTPLALLNGDGK